MTEELDPVYFTTGERDFLIPAVWEGTGDELHTNRLVAAASDFGGRIMSGIATMTLAVARLDGARLGAPPACLEWDFAGPVREGEKVRVDASREGGDLTVATSVDGATTGTGVLRAAPAEAPAPAGGPDGARSRGWTITAADLELFADWIGAGGEDGRDGGSGPVPWPLLILVASGLMGRDRLFGDAPSGQVLNRWMRWRFASMPVTGETVHCVLRSRTSRRSKTRPGDLVSRIVLDTRSADDGRALTEIDWVVLSR
ncbi:MULTISPECIES: MaoC/PaaZ C-terminal domain-containing protein [Actinomadura]|uniref:MaoC/PaaZ C-terminal domain-containing protein n=1 Tax=Actinomadura TaxID=1988 RepID=UPI001486F6E9|nr:MaoC/PaaZ C-terminal domain-containing protein [Actinomadura geliboluensis]